MRGMPRLITPFCLQESPILCLRDLAFCVQLWKTLKTGIQVRFCVFHLFPSLTLDCQFLPKGEQFESFYALLGSHFVNLRILYEDRVRSFCRLPVRFYLRKFDSSSPSSPTISRPSLRLSSRVSRRDRCSSTK